jgi:hypothetical protein
MPGQGTATLDFGAFPGGTMASVTVTGQAGILAGSLAEAWIFPGAGTADHSVDEHLLMAAQIQVIACDVVAGVGFTITAVARWQQPEPLELPGIARVNRASGTTGQNANPPQGVFASVGGADTSLHYGLVNVAWVWA